MPRICLTNSIAVFKFRGIKTENAVRSVPIYLETAEGSEVLKYRPAKKQHTKSLKVSKL